MARVAVSRLLIALISGFALWDVFGLSVTEWSASGACPMIAGVPACYVVTGAYLAIFTSALISKKPLYIPLFVAGAGVVFGLGTIGSFIQFTGLGECPKTADGFPLCYISLSIGVLLIGLFVLREKARPA